MVGGGRGCYEHSSTCATGSALQVAHSSASPPQKGPVCTQKSPPRGRAGLSRVTDAGRGGYGGAGAPAPATHRSQRKRRG